MQVRAVTSDERQAVTRLAQARTVPARAVERARVVLAALDGQLVEEIAAQQPLARNTVYMWLHRFDERGVAWRAWRIARAAAAHEPLQANKWVRSWRRR